MKTNKELIKNKSEFIYYKSLVFSLKNAFEKHNINFYDDFNYADIWRKAKLGTKKPTEQAMKIMDNAFYLGGFNTDPLIGFYHSGYQKISPHMRSIILRAECRWLRA